MPAMKRLLTATEEATNDILGPLCEKWGAHVWRKVRVADVLPIEGSGISAAEFRFALQSHFDFLVIGNDYYPLFAVEFDGGTHASATQQRRDERKNHLCEHFQFPLLRINSRYLVQQFRQMDILSWFVNYWFASKMIDDAYEQGHIPSHEYVDPTMCVTLPGTETKFPLWLSANVLCKIRTLYKQGRCRDACPSCTVGSDTSGTYRAIAYIRVTEDSVVITRTGMRNQHFPAPLSEILEEIAVHETYYELLDVLNHRTSPQQLDDLQRQLDEFKEQFKIVSLSAYGSPPTSLKGGAT